MGGGSWAEDFFFRDPDDVLRRLDIHVDYGSRG
jgi:hypothetical protein